MSFLSRLKNVALSAYHGVAPNFIDHGQGWTAQAPPPRPVVQQPVRPPMPPPRVQNTFTPNLKAPGQIQIGPVKTPKISTPKVKGSSLASRLLHVVTHNPVTNFTGTAVVKPIVHTAVSTGQAVGHIASIPYDVGRTIPASLTKNKIALKNANEAANRNINEGIGFAQFLPRAAVQVGISLNPKGHPTERSRVPKKGVGQVFLGKDEIPSLQKVYKGVQQTEGTQAAVGNTALTALMDALALKGGKDTAHATVKATPAVITKAADMIKTPLNQAGGISLASAAAKHPAVQALDDHLTTLNTVRSNIMANNGSKTALRQNDLAYKATLQAKKDTIRQVKEGGYIKVGYPNASKLPKEAQEGIKSFNRSNNSTPEQRIKSNKLTNSDIGRAVPNDQVRPFTQTDIKTLAKSVPEFKEKPVMTFDPKGEVAGEIAPTLEYKTANHHIKINANNYFARGTDLSKLKKGEEVDLSAALGGGANKIPAVIESKPGAKLPVDQTKTAPGVKLPAKPQPPEKIIVSTKTTAEPKNQKLAPEANVFVNEKLKQAGVDPHNMTPADTAEFNKIMDESHKVEPNKPTTAEHIGQVIHRMANNEPLDIRPKSKTKPVNKSTAADKPKGGTPPPTGDIKTIVAIDNLQRAGKPIPPELAQKAGMALAGDRKVKPQGAKISDAEWGSLLKSGQKLEPDTIDHVMANAGGDANVYATEKAKKAMYQMADQRAFQFLENKGNRNTAIELYRKETGASEKMATYRINMVQHTLNLRKAPPGSNPMTEKVKVPAVKPGDYRGARANVQVATSHINISGQILVRAVERLNRKEKKQFADLIEHPEDKAQNASKNLRDAVAQYRDLADRIHATSQSLGGETPYRSNYFNHNVDLKNPEDKARYLEMIGKRKDTKANPDDFVGLDRMPRVFPDIRALHAAGFHLKNESKPIKQVEEYIGGAIYQLRKQALLKGFTEADMLAPKKNRSFDLQNGQTIPLSETGMKEIRTFEKKTSDNVAIKALRTANSAAKSTLLSLSQFHPFNIAVLRAAPTLALKGHPIRAVKGAVKTFRPLLPGGKRAVDKMLKRALDDGIVDKAAAIGMPYVERGYNIEGTFLKSAGVGHKLVFERQMPMMHDQVVRSVIHDLEQRKIPLESEAARKVGTVANATMGFINKEALNMGPRTRQFMTDWMLAGQFTPSKGIVVGKSFTGGLAGKYARADVISNVVSSYAILSGIAYLVHQNSDDARDILLRAIIDPAVPTPFKDKKGNTQELRTPLTNTAEIAHILGARLKRGQDGHLHVDWSAKNVPTTMQDWLRARLSPGAGTALKLKTNTSFANKPLYDPNAPGGTKAIQAGTTIGQGLLPIGAQGLLYTKKVKEHLPGTAQEILDANTPGTNPGLKSLTSSIGFTPRTDKTTGKGLQSTQYFGALGEAGRGLNKREAAALEIYAGAKKNPVTGKYEVAPTLDDQRAKATTLLQNPKVIDRLMAMNKRLKDEGQKVDPLWVQGGLKPGDIGYIDAKEQIKRYLQYQAMPPHGPDQKDWHNKNDTWYKPLAADRAKFFDSLPPSDPNKPKAPLEYPSTSGQLKTRMDRFFSLQDSKSRAQYLKNYPEIQKQLDAQDEYYNKLRKSQGYAANKAYPKASPQLQGFIDMYLGADKATRKGLRSTNADNYRAMSAYFDQTALHGINQQGGVSALEGEPDYTAKELKQISNVAKDIYQMPDGSFQLVPAGWTLGLTNGSSGIGFGRKKGARVRTPRPGFRHLKIKKTSIKASSNNANATFNREVSQIGIKPGGSNKIRIAA